MHWDEKKYLFTQKYVYLFTISAFSPDYLHLESVESLEIVFFLFK